MKNHVGHVVRVSGKVVSLNGETAILEATDNGQIEVILNGQSQWGTTFVEVIGQVSSENTLKEYTFTNLGDSFDLALANKVVEYGQKCPELFV
ncbi:hypothetical protein Unana1_02625 [Umbelopsis nana]